MQLNSVLKEYVGKYDIVDIMASMGEILLSDKSLNISSYYNVNRYILMKAQHSGNEMFAFSCIKEKLIVMSIQTENSINYTFKSLDGREIGRVIIEDIMEKLKVISGLVVYEYLRNKGYGKLIMQTVMNQYPESDFVLYVMENNRVAIQLCKSIGFKVLNTYINFGVRS